MCAGIVSLITPDLRASPTQVANQWIYVTRRFQEFLSNITLTDDQLEDGRTKIKGIVKSLNRHYWGIESDSTNYRLVGSWGKRTRVRPPRDIDIMFFLPAAVHQRFSERVGNSQSQLLQEVKDALSVTYSTTRMRGDGQVVVVPFNSFRVEVVPAFELQNGQTLICDTNNGGQYKTSDPIAEIKAFDTASQLSNGNTRDLVRMLKCWQTECSVPLKSFQLELLAMEFTEKWEYKGNDRFWYDWMVRDFFRFLQGKANGFVFQPGTYELISLGNDWLPKAERAYKVALDACEYEKTNIDILAQMYWKEIFGAEIKAIV